MGFLKTFDAKSTSKGTNTFMTNTTAGVDKNTKNVSKVFEPACKDITGEVNNLLSSPILMIGLACISIITFYGISQAGSTVNKGLSVIDNNPQLGMEAMRLVANS